MNNNNKNKESLTKRKIVLKQAEQPVDFAEILAHVITGGHYDDYIVKNGLLKTE